MRKDDKFSSFLKNSNNNNKLVSFTTFWKLLIWIGSITTSSLLVLSAIKLLFNTYHYFSHLWSSSSSISDDDDDDWVIHVPIPWLKGNPPPPIDNDVDEMTQYLNHIGRAFDFLHKNYLHFRSKSLTQIPAYVLQKRLKPIMIEQKVQLAKQLLIQDLKDSIEKCNLQLLVSRQQIRELRKRLPPKLPFLYKSKYAPFYWILTDLDYAQMSPALKNLLLYNANNNLVASHTSFNRSHMYDRSERFHMTELDEKELDHFLFINPYSTIPRRLKRLRSIWIQSQNDENLKQVIEQEQNDLFSNYCFKLLRKRAKIIVRRIRRIRRVEMRSVMRERSRHISELTLCNKLQLQKNVPLQQLNI